MTATLRSRLFSRPELIVLCALAVLTRFWALFTPNAVVWDEALYEEYVSHYFSGTYYFNLHPPVAKLLLALAARILGISGETLAVPDPAAALRILPALAGALIIPVFWLFLRQLGASRRVAMLGALLLVLDTSMVAVSRLILIDSMLILFMLGAITSCLAARSREGRAKWGFIALSGALAGLAVGTKWTGLSAIGMLGVFWLQRVISRAPRRELALEASVIAAASAVVYVGSFAVHFALLPLSGPGDRMMSERFQSTLLRSPLYDPTLRVSFGEKLVDMHRAMRHGNAEHVAIAHAGASPWWSWPILKHALYIWESEPRPDGRVGRILIEGNPVVWWGILIALGPLAILALTVGRLRANLAIRRDVLFVLLTGYLMNFLPFILIDRILFLYSYFPAMIFSLALAVVGVTTLTGESPRTVRYWWSFAGLALAAFLYFSPFVYGSPLSDDGFRVRRAIMER
jgi:dolichyl-phosphate-mannose-protein mannosyltransferase